MFLLTQKAKDVIIAMGWPQTLVAERTGIDAGRISKIMNGAEPTKPEMDKFFNTFQFKIEDVWERVEEGAEAIEPQRRSDGSVDDGR